MTEFIVKEQDSAKRKKKANFKRIPKKLLLKQKL